RAGFSHPQADGTIRERRFSEMGQAYISHGWPPAGVVEDYQDAGRQELESPHQGWKQARRRERNCHCAYHAQEHAQTGYGATGAGQGHGRYVAESAFKAAAASYEGFLCGGGGPEVCFGRRAGPEYESLRRLSREVVSMKTAIGTPNPWFSHCLIGP